MEGLGPRYFGGGYDVAGQDTDKYPYRLLYSGQVPTGPQGYEVIPCETMLAAGQITLSQQARDNHPTSRVVANLFFVQRWDGERWDDYAGPDDPEDWEDLTDAAEEVARAALDEEAS